MNGFIKLKNRGGFSLTELLITVLILGLVSAVVAAGVPAAVAAHKKIVEKANAQLLLTTTTNALRNELDMASDIVVTESGGEVVISFTSNKKYSLTITSGSEGIIVNEYTEGGSAASLVSGAAASGLIVEFTGATPADDGSAITITGLKVTNSEGTELASLAEYTIDVFR